MTRCDKDVRQRFAAPQALHLYIETLACAPYIYTCTHPALPMQALEARCSELHREVASQGALLAGDIGRLARESNALRVEVSSASNLAKKVGQG